MEKSIPFGLVAGLGLVFGAIFLGEGWQTFFDVPSMIIVGGGTAASLLVNYSLDALRKVPNRMKEMLTFEPPEMHGFVTTFSDLSRTARREGLLALDRELDTIDDDLMRFGLEMAVDGTPEEELAGMLDQQISEEARERRLLSGFFNTAGTYAPAFGMIGTLIGLIQMLQNLDDPTQIGAGMSVAMVTTFYGALLANLVFLPLSAKAREQMAHTMQARTLVRTGILAITRGEGPSSIERRLQLYLPGGPERPAVDTPADPPPLSKAA